jgi:hypothetical protein
MTELRIAIILEVCWAEDKFGWKGRMGYAHFMYRDGYIANHLYLHY